MGGQQFTQNLEPVRFLGIRKRGVELLHLFAELVIFVVQKLFKIS